MAMIVRHDTGARISCLDFLPTDNEGDFNGLPGHFIVFGLQAYSFR